MRHKNITEREVSQVLKLVFFQVLATIGTTNVMVLNTEGTFNRHWYMLGGFMLINGMVVDLGMITCVVQGWNIGVQISRRIVAKNALTQYEADIAYAVKADGYIVDRLQMVTKFIVMTYIYSSVMPLLWGIVVVVLVASIYLDRRNLLRVFSPAAHSDESAVKAILVYVMPLAILSHLLVSYFMMRSMFKESTEDWFAEQMHVITAAMDTVLGLNITGDVSNTPQVNITGDVPNTPQAATPGFDITNLTNTLLGSFGDPDSDALEMVWLSLVINGPLVVVFILREWGRKWGRQVNLDVLLQVPGNAIGFGGRFVERMAKKASLPAGKLKEIQKGLYSEVKGAAAEAQTVLGVLSKGADEEHMALDAATRRTLETIGKMEYDDMIKRCVKQWGDQLGAEHWAERLYYKYPHKQRMLALIEELVTSGHMKRGKSVLLNQKGSPLKMPKGRPPSNQPNPVSQHV